MLEAHLTGRNCVEFRNPNGDRFRIEPDGNGIRINFVSGQFSDQIAIAPEVANAVGIYPSETRHGR
jgi:hypothetical protein